MLILPHGQSAAAVASFNILMSILNEMIRTHPHFSRTVAIIYENQTLDVASDVYLALDAYYAPILLLNLDSMEKIKWRGKREVGADFFNICVLTNVTNEAILKQMYAQHLIMGTHRVYFSIFIQKATHHQIERFFRRQFEHAILRASACFLGDSIEIYTHFPFKRQFASKVMEINRTTQAWSPYLFEELYRRKDRNLLNATIKVFIAENIPKAFRLPGRYRVMSSKFYFVGRDGYLAKTSENLLNASWKYLSVPDEYVKKVAQFSLTKRASGTDFYGQRLNFDDENPQSLTYINLSLNEPLSNAYNDCEIIFHSMPVIVVNPKNRFRSIYPHEFDSLVILVQNILYSDTSLRDFYIFISAILSMFVTAVVFSKLFRMLSKEPKQDISRVALDALGSLLATNPKAAVSKLSVGILQFSMVIFSILFGIFASTFLLGLLLTKNTCHNINKLDELAASNLRIFITPELNESIHEWGHNLDHRILRKIDVTTEKTLLTELLSKNFGVAYVISKRKAEVILDLPDFKENGVSMFHMMRECLVPALMAFQVSMNSTLDITMQRVIEGTQENGYFNFYTEYALMLIRRLTENKLRISSTLETKRSLNTYHSAQIIPIFVCFNIGLSIAFLVLLAEIAYFKYGRRCRRALRRILSKYR